MKQTLTIEIPTSWGDITLKQYLTMQSELENYRDDEEAQIAIMLLHLCKIQPQYLKGLSADSYNLLKAKLTEFVSPEGIELKKFITLNGKEYGFEPNLSKMAYGAYADITQWDTISIDKNWPKIMSILYRPVTQKKGDRYQIETYTGEWNEELFLTTDMDTNWGCLFFFINLQKDLLNATQKYLKGMELPPNIKSTLEKSGEVMQRLLNLQTVTLKK
jgi:hypothetical protein